MSRAKIADRYQHNVRTWWEEAGVLGERGDWMGHEWRERFSQWVQCSAQHVLALHATPPNTTTTTTTSSPSLPSPFLTLFTSFLSIFHNYFSPIPHHPSHISAIYPAPQYVDGDRQIGPLCVCVCVCVCWCEECGPLTTTGTTWRPMRGLDNVTDRGWCKPNVGIFTFRCEARQLVAKAAGTEGSNWNLITDQNGVSYSGAAHTSRGRSLSFRV